MKRAHPIRNCTTHHVYSKSIQNFEIFNSPAEYERFFKLMRYYKHDGLKTPFSQLIREDRNVAGSFEERLEKFTQDKDQLVAIVAYCLMPTHYHLILHQLLPDGIERFIKNVCNSYSHYFNLRHNRRGPLWQARFGNSRIEHQHEMQHATRYVHLNPTTARLTDKPQSWHYSSFGEYIGRPMMPQVCENELFVRMDAKEYEKFTVDFISEQRRRKERRKHPFKFDDDQKEPKISKRSLTI